MSTARSAFTEAIEEHLALKKQNATLEQSMPLARYDVGDPLDRYPGGPGRAAEGGTVVIADGVETRPDQPHEDQASLVGPSPEQAMEAATALEPAFADRPFEPLNGLAPMLSLVEDIEDDAAEPAASPEPSSADVLRFPGGVGPREEVAPEEDELSDVAAEPAHVQASGVPAHQAASSHDSELDLDAPTGEQPVLVIDTDEPLGTSGFDEPVEPSRSSHRKPRFFGIGRKRSSRSDATDGWFTDGPRDFNWD